jgi:hypothetical protein
VKFSSHKDQVLIGRSGKQPNFVKGVDTMQSGSNPLLRSNGEERGTRNGCEVRDREPAAGDKDVAIFSNLLPEKGPSADPAMLSSPCTVCCMTIDNRPW